MRKILPVLLMVGLAGCASTMRWQKPGISDEGTSVDLGSCRHAAAAEANRYFYPVGWARWGSPGFGWGGWGYRRSSLWWQMRADDERFYAERRLTDFCMRTKGYELVDVKKPDAKAPAAPTPSPEPR